MNPTVGGTLVSLKSRHRAVCRTDNPTRTPFCKTKLCLFTPAWLGRKAKMDYKISSCTLCLPQNNLLGKIEYSATSQSFDYLESGLCLGK